jgi:ankyrin repeat protein
LHTAITNQDQEAFSLLLNGRADANVMAEDGHIALHAAMRALYRDSGGTDESTQSDTWATCYRMVLGVIPLTTDVNAAAQDGQTALAAAAANGSIEIMEALLQNRALPDRGARGGTSPLSFAAQCGQVDAVKLLLRSRADPSRADRGGQTALHRLASNWLWQDADPRRSDDHWISCKGRRLLGREEAARVLIDANANVNSLDIIGRTPLLLASDPPTPVVVSKEQQSVVNMLLNLRSNANQASSTGITPLVAAVQKDVEVIAHQLLNHGVDANSPEPLSGSRPLKIAIQRMHTGIVKELIEHRAEVASVDRMGQSAASAWVDSFSSAYKAKRGPWAPKQRLFEDILQVLTDGRVEQAFAPCRGAPPLLSAWKQLDGLGQRAAIQMLLQARADPNSVDSSGRTLLHSICGSLANHRSTVAMMELLQSVLHARADAVRESEGGETPLDLAAHAGPAAQQALKALLDSLPERSLTAPRWSRLLFKELEGGNEQIISSLVPRTGTAHLNDLGQGPLEALLGNSLFRCPPASQQEASLEMRHEVDPEHSLVQIRLAELFQQHGAVLPTPAWVWSRSWAAARCSQALTRLEELGEQGPKHLASLADLGEPLPKSLSALLVAACVLSGVESAPPDSFYEGTAAEKETSLADCAAGFCSAVQQLLAGEGTMLLPRLACASSPEVHSCAPMSALMLRQMGNYLQDSALSSEDALQAAGGAAAAQLGVWVRATYELHHVPRLAPVTLQAS